MLSERSRTRSRTCSRRSRRRPAASVRLPEDVPPASGRLLSAIADAKTIGYVGEVPAEELARSSTCGWGGRAAAERRSSTPARPRSRSATTPRRRTGSRRPRTPAASSTRSRGPGRLVAQSHKARPSCSFRAMTLPPTCPCGPAESAGNVIDGHVPGARRRLGRSRHPRYRVPGARRLDDESRGPRAATSPIGAPAGTGRARLAGEAGWPRRRRALALSGRGLRGGVRLVRYDLGDADGAAGSDRASGSEPQSPAAAQGHAAGSVPAAVQRARGGARREPPVPAAGCRGGALRPKTRNDSASRPATRFAHSNGTSARLRARVRAGLTRQLVPTSTPASSRKARWR